MCRDQQYRRCTVCTVYYINVYRQSHFHAGLSTFLRRRALLFSPADKDIRDSRQTPRLPAWVLYTVGLPIHHRLLVRVSSRPIINPGAALRLRPGSTILIIGFIIEYHLDTVSGLTDATRCRCSGMFFTQIGILRK